MLSSQPSGQLLPATLPLLRTTQPGGSALPSRSGSPSLPPIMTLQMAGFSAPPPALPPQTSGHSSEGFDAPYMHSARSSRPSHLRPLYPGGSVGGVTGGGGRRPSGSPTAGNAAGRPVAWDPWGSDREAQERSSCSDGDPSPLLGSALGSTAAVTAVTAAVTHDAAQAPAPGSSQAAVAEDSSGHSDQSISHSLQLACHSNHSGQRSSHSHTRLSRLSTCEITLQGGVVSAAPLDPITEGLRPASSAVTQLGEAGQLFIQLLQDVTAAPASPPAVTHQRAVTRGPALDASLPVDEIAGRRQPRPPAAVPSQPRRRPAPHASQPHTASQPLPYASQLAAEEQRMLSQLYTIGTTSLHSPSPSADEASDNDLPESAAVRHAHARHCSVILPWELVPGGPAPILATRPTSMLDVTAADREGAGPSPVPHHARARRSSLPTILGNDTATNSLQLADLAAAAAVAAAAEPATQDLSEHGRARSARPAWAVTPTDQQSHDQHASTSLAVTSPDPTASHQSRPMRENSKPGKNSPFGVLGAVLRLLPHGSRTPRSDFLLASGSGSGYGSGSGSGAPGSGFTSEQSSLHAAAAAAAASSKAASFDAWQRSTPPLQGAPRPAPRPAPISVNADGVPVAPPAAVTDGVTASPGSVTLAAVTPPAPVTVTLAAAPPSAFLRESQDCSTSFHRDTSYSSQPTSSFLFSLASSSLTHTPSSRLSPRPSDPVSIWPAGSDSSLLLPSSQPGSASILAHSRPAAGKAFASKADLGRYEAHAASASQPHTLHQLPDLLEEPEGLGYGMKDGQQEWGWE